VAQIKKKQIKQAILDSAYEMFSKRGYSDTNITDIARAAGVAPANVYVYFRSKIDILFSLYEPWLTSQFDELEASLRRTRNSRQFIRKILSVLWQEIPSRDNGFANNLMQALAITTTREGYRPTLRLAIERRLAKLLDDRLPNLGHAASRDIANIALMAFDGYVLNFHLQGGATCPGKRLTLFGDMLLQYAEGALAPAKAPPRRVEKLRAVARTTMSSTTRIAG
jgi:AcrR family transcriptional regulator